MNMPDEQPNYENFEWLDSYQWDDFLEMNAAREVLRNELIEAGHITATRPRKNNAFEAIKLVIMNLYNAYKSGKETYVAYSRNRNEYNGKDGYFYEVISYDFLRPTVDGLIALGYIENQNGFRNHDTKVSKVSRMRATLAFIEKLERELNVNAYTITFSKPFSPESSVVLKDGEKELVAFEETERTAQLRRDITSYNELLWSSYIDANLSYIEPDSSYHCDLSRKSVRAVFNNNSFKLGGRLYGAWWIQCKSRIRECIHINGEWTHELDYKSFHPRLLYALESQNLSADPYDVSVLPAGIANHPKSRNLMKLLFMVMINNNSQGRAKNAVRTEVWRYPEDYPPKESFISELDRIIEEYKRLHSPIEHKLFTGIGLTLQNIDAAITMELVNIMTDLDIPILTIHDSYVCDHKHHALLQEQMDKALNQFLISQRVHDLYGNTDPTIKEKEYATRIFDTLNDEGENVAELAEQLEYGNNAYNRRYKKWMDSDNPNQFYS